MESEIQKLEKHLDSLLITHGHDYHDDEVKIRSKAGFVTKNLQAKFEKFFHIEEIVEGEDFRPPFAISWKIKEKF